MNMPCLIDTIEDAFREAALDRDGDVVQTTPVVEAIERYAKTSDDMRGSIEGVVDDAYLAARRLYANDWHAYTGHVAELICDGLRRFVGSEDDVTTRRVS
jgi:hypothetical protein